MPAGTEGTIQEAKKKVFRFIGYRPRTEFEIVQKLKDQQFSDEVIQQTIAFFKTNGLINDQDFAKLWIQSRLRKPLGFKRIKLELSEKGLDPDSIDHAFAIVKDDYDESAVIRQTVQRRIKCSKNADPLKMKQRLCNYLIRRGFDSYLIKKVLNEL